MTQERKTYAKNDELLLGDLREDENPQTDMFKMSRVKKVVKPDPIIKLTSVPWAKTMHSGSLVRRGKVSQRWSEAELKHSHLKKRLFDCLPAATTLLSDLEPLYSSFN